MGKKIIRKLKYFCSLNTNSQFERIERSIAWSTFFLIFAYCILLRLQLPHVPIVDADSWGYLSPALSWLSGNGLQQTHGREWLYPVLLVGFITSGNGFVGIAWWQHLFALLALLFLWLGLRTWQQFLPPLALLRCIGTPLIILAIALVGLNPEILRFEIGIRPEIIFQFSVIVQLTCLIKFIKARWLHPNPITFWLFGSLVIALSYMNLLLKPSWGISLLLTVLPVLIGLLSKPSFAKASSDNFTYKALQSNFQKASLAVFITSGALIAILIFLPRPFGWKHDSASVTHPALTLFSIHADIILQSIKKQNQQVEESQQQLYKNLIKDLEQELTYARKNTRSFTHLGFDPDYIMYRSNLPWKIRDQNQFGDAELARFLKSLYFQAWKTEPIAMANKIMRQFQIFAFPPSSTFYKTTSELTKRFEDAPHLIPVDLSEHEKVANIYARYREDLLNPANAPKNITTYRFLQSVAGYFGLLAPTIQILFLGLLLITFYKKLLYSLRLSGATAFAIALASYGNALSLAIFHTIDVDRYRYTYGPFLLMALIMMGLFCLAVLQKLIVPDISCENEKVALLPKK